MIGTDPIAPTTDETSGPPTRQDSRHDSVPLPVSATLNRKERRRLASGIKPARQPCPCCQPADGGAVLVSKALSAEHVG